AKVNVKDNLDYTLTSACRLEYRGSPAIGRHEATGGSSVARLTQGLQKDQTDLQQHANAFGKHLAEIHNRMHAGHTGSNHKGEADLPHHADALREHLAEIHAPLHAAHAGSVQMQMLHAFVHPASQSNHKPSPNSAVRVAVGEKVPDLLLKSLD